MEFGIRSRFRNAWNAFVNNRLDKTFSTDFGMSYSYPSDRRRLAGASDRSIATAVYNRIATDAAAISIRHVKLNEENEYYESTINDELNARLNLEANLDQTGRAFIQDAVQTLISNGVMALVPVDTDTDPNDYQAFKIHSIRVGIIKEWFPHHVKVSVYNENTGKRQDVTMLKRAVAIVENPFYSVMNEPNSTMQRLIHKLSLLDVIDEQSSSGKLDLIIQLPYVIKTEARRKQAEVRRKDIENQLAGSKYGIAYTDGTEHITQLNRPVENNLLKQVEYLTSMLFGQLGLTQAIMDGSADERTMLNYYTRTIEPIISAIVDEMKRKFLSPTARTQHQSIMFFRDPFKLVPVADLAELGDKFTRNEILSSNEVRQVIGFRPSKDPRADELKNKNLNDPTLKQGRAPVIEKEEVKNQNEQEESD